MTAGPGPERESRDAVPLRAALVFAPVHKRALGLAVGSACWLVIFTVTLVHLVFPGRDYPDIALLSEYFVGYRVSWTGAFIGAFWAFVAGFVGGWFLAFCRNLVLAASIFLTRTRAELSASRDFLDHI